MTGRYQELFRLKSNLYLDGSPVIIEAGALQKDSVDNRVLAQLKFRNISDRAILSCKVTIWAYEISGKELEGIQSFSYLDMKAFPGKDFGSKTPVYLPDITTRKIEVAVTEIVFDDNSLWNAVLTEWTPIPAQKPIGEVLSDRELIKQYEIEISGKASFCPKYTRGLFLCTCGTANQENAERCYSCNRRRETVFNALNTEELNARRNARIKKEQEDKEKADREAALAIERKAEEERKRQEEREAKKRKRIKKFFISITVFLCICVLTFICRHVLAYYIGKAFMKTHNYSAAVYLFEQANGFKDSSACVLEAEYKYVNKNLDSVNKTTYAYLKELVDNDYEDSKIIYDDLYRIQIEIIAINQSENSMAHIDKALLTDSHNTIYCHYKVTGGTPDSDPVTIKVKWWHNKSGYPDSSHFYEGMEYVEVYKGSTNYFYLKTGHKCSRITFCFYENGHHLAEESIDYDFY